MPISYIRKSGTDAQPFIYTASAYVDGTLPVFTGATVEFVGVKYGETAPTISGAGTISGLTFNYFSTPTELASPGFYRCEWVVTYSNGKTERWPSADIETGQPEYLTLVIVPALT